MSNYTGHAKSCPECGAVTLVTRVGPHELVFQGIYGLRTENIEVPEIYCETCKYAAIPGELDEEVERLEQAAQLRFIAEEIVEIRERSGLNRRDWLELSKIGDASLSRWENAVIAANASMQQYLYLLSFKDNVARLLQKAGKIHQQMRAVLEVDHSHSTIEEDDLGKRFPGGIFDGGMRQNSGSFFPMSCASQLEAA